MKPFDIMLVTLSIGALGYLYFVLNYFFVSKTL